jgi:hypothetical protein
MLLFKNEYPAKKSNRWNESLLDDAAAGAAGVGANAGIKLRLFVTLAGAGVLSGAASVTQAFVFPAVVCAPAGIAAIAKTALNVNDEITPSFFISVYLPV